MNGAGCMTVARRVRAVLVLALQRGLFGKLAQPTPGGDEPITLTRDELDVLLASAVDDGWRRGYAAGKGLPKPAGLISDQVAA